LESTRRWGGRSSQACRQRVAADAGKNTPRLSQASSGTRDVSTIHRPPRSQCTAGDFLRERPMTPLPSLANSESLSLVPKGQPENSPAFQRRVVANYPTSPEGTAETDRATMVQPSLRDSNASECIPGVETPGYSQAVPSGQRTPIQCPAPKAPALDAPRTLIDELLAEQQTLTAVDRFSNLHVQNGVPAQQKFYRDLIPLAKPRAGEQYAFVVDLDKCSGCKACVSACHSLNGLDDDETWRSVGLLVGADAFQQHVTTACHHCVDPACLNGCPSWLTKRRGYWHRPASR